MVSSRRMSIHINPTTPDLDPEAQEAAKKADDCSLLLNF